MPKAAFTTLGCRVNQYETQAILESFACAGFTIVPFGEAADVYVVNSCSVTQHAESKSRQLVRSISRRRPNSKVVVTGCAAQMSLNTKQDFEGAALIVPNPQKLDTAKLFLAAYPEFLAQAARPATEARRFEGRTRATIKIQDGCNVMCSYCSIPYTRPERKSRHFQDILSEANRYARLGHPEIVIAGVLIGDYGPETGSGGPNFEELLHMICADPLVQRVRISSIEFRQVTPTLIQLIAGPGSKICPHLHIPLQSGSSAVLEDMNRPYRKDDYLELCKVLKLQIPNIGISTDIMVGFPTETDADFDHTAEVCEEVKFCKGHIFRFSLRPGTPAHQWGDPVSPQTKQMRSERLIAITNRTREEFARKHIGACLTVAVEERRNREGKLVGLSENYIEVQFDGPDSLFGKLVSVQVTSTEAGTAFGKLARDFAPVSNSSKLRVLNP